MKVHEHLRVMENDREVRGKRVVTCRQARGTRVERGVAILHNILPALVA